MLKNVVHQHLKEKKILKNISQTYNKNIKIRENFLKLHSFSVQGTSLQVFLSLPN